ncbi:MAG TPA: metallophosphoesterase [Paludibacter sp.]|nr:metallophosphoesterase [Paludibacter sp.]
MLLSNCFLAGRLFAARFFSLIILSACLVACAESGGQYYKDNAWGFGDDSTSVRFLVLSDWGFSGSLGQREVAGEMSRISRRARVDFILTAGDNFQVAGVAGVDDSLWVDNFVNIYSDSALHVPWYPALGNHDYYGDPDAQVEYSAHSNYWKMPARYYTFAEKIDSANSVRFIVLDTQGLINGYNALEDTAQYAGIPEYAWLKNILATSTEKWKIVTGHHPVFSASTFHGDTYEMKRLVKPLFDQYGVDFYVCGHDHDFEHAKDPGNYTDYIVTGTGGYVRPIQKNERTVFALSAIGVSYFIVRPGAVEMCFVTPADRVAYSYNKRK